MDYNPEIARRYEQKLRTSGLLGESDIVAGVEDNGQDYRQSGQVFWWTVNVELASGGRKTFVMKSPYDTFGDGINFFVRRRVELSKQLREAGINVPVIGEYDRGTFAHEYVEGVELGRAVKNATQEQRESLLRQRSDIVRKCEELGLRLMDNHDGNFIVTEDGKVVLLDLDINSTR